MLNDMTKEKIAKTVQSLTEAATIYGGLENDLTLPSVFQQAGAWITLAQHILQNAHKELEKTGEKSVGQDLYECSKRCELKSGTLLKVFKNVATGTEGARTKLYAVAVTVDKDRAVEVVLGGRGDS